MKSIVLFVDYIDLFRSVFKVLPQSTTACLFNITGNQNLSSFQEAPLSQELWISTIVSTRNIH